MNPFIPVLKTENKKPLYIQIYEAIKEEIVSGRLKSGEKLPSLRGMAANMKLSITTVELAYNQLSVEGYIFSREKSGYFIGNAGDILNRPLIYKPPVLQRQSPVGEAETREMYADTALFDFVKWKKCLNQVINEFPHQLAREASPSGEQPLKEQISHYLYLSRGVQCRPEQIIIAAGTQQILNIISSFFTLMEIDGIAYENPGYFAGSNTFKDRGFTTFPIPLKNNGISLTKIEEINPSVICVSPSNQFPSGIVMPAGKRYSLLRYAHANDCIIIEDDYASELRYFGRPVPPVKSLDQNGPVLYLGSFSSVMFPSSKISYMVLPERFAPFHNEVLSLHTQTCSKTEQLALALYMEKGLFQIHIKKLRKLYSQKINAATAALKEAFGSAITIRNKDSGLNMLLEITSSLSDEILCSTAASVGLNMVSIHRFQEEKKEESRQKHTLIFYYHFIPLEELPFAIFNLKQVWQTR